MKLVTSVAAGAAAGSAAGFAAGFARRVWQESRQRAMSTGPSAPAAALPGGPGQSEFYPAIPKAHFEAWREQYASELYDEFTATAVAEIDEMLPIHDAELRASVTAALTADFNRWLVEHDAQMVADFNTWLKQHATEAAGGATYPGPAAD